VVKREAGKRFCLDWSEVVLARARLEAVGVGGCPAGGVTPKLAGKCLFDRRQFTSDRWARSPARIFKTHAGCSRVMGEGRASGGRGAKGLINMYFRGSGEGAD